MTVITADLSIRDQNGVGLAILNRPAAINSLNHTMVSALHAALIDWELDDDVHTVMVSGAGERGLCAGGDIVAIYQSAKDDGVDARHFWHDEYQLIARIHGFPKPYVALMDGIVMGGGVGVSAHGSIRIVTDTTRMAMPEVGIGLIPDVGGTYLLARTPGMLGLHAALTGAPFNGADAIAMGFADYFVPHDRLARFTQTMIADGVDRALAVHAVAPPNSSLLAQRDWIDKCYSAGTIVEIVTALRGHDTRSANDAATMIANRSPIAVAVTLEAIRRAGRLDSLEHVLRQEYRTSCASLRSHDLVEGIRAQVIDKDRDPSWSPALLTAIKPSDVEAYFAPADPDLSFGDEEQP